MTSTLSRSNATGRATRELLLVTAEELFGRRGIDAVTLKEIGDASGQRNKVVTQYHFGDKDGLVAAIVEHRYPAIHQSQVALLSAATANGGPSDLRTLARVMVGPAAEQVAAGTWFVPFLSRLFADRAARLHFLSHNNLLLDIHTAMGRALQAAMSEVSRPRFGHRYALCTTLILQALGDQQLAMVAGEETMSFEDCVEDLVSMVAGALRGGS